MSESVPETPGASAPARKVVKPTVVATAQPLRVRRAVARLQSRDGVQVPALSSFEHRPIAQLNDALMRLANAQRRALAGLKGQLLAHSAGKARKSLLVTSGLNGEGKTTAAVTMAAGLARSCQGPVFLLDANLQHPNLHELFNVDAEPGLTDVLLGTADLSEVVYRTTINNLFVVPAGTTDGDAQHILETPRFREALRDIARQGDYVIIDGASMLSAPDTVLMVPGVDGVIQVVECERTRRDVPDEVRERVESVDGTFLGAVLNKRRFYLPRLFYGRL
ncbi:MAG: CpsD/CapB family tyrosine-protein kinase [Rhodospirillales bacterium]